MVAIRVLGFEVVGFGPAVLVVIRSLPEDLVDFIAKELFFSFNEGVEVFKIEFGVVEFINFILIVESFAGVVLGVIVVLETVEFLIMKLLVGVGVVDLKIDFVVVKFEFIVEILIGLNVTFDELADIVMDFGVVVFVKLMVEIEV